MTAQLDGRGVSVYEMIRVVGRAEIACGGTSAEKITAYLKGLDTEELIAKFHQAVVILAQRGLLSPQEQTAAADYARDWVASQPIAVSA